MLTSLMNFLRTTTVGGYTLVEILAVASVFLVVLYFLTRIVCRTCSCILHTVRRRNERKAQPPVGPRPPMPTVEPEPRRTIPYRQHQLVPFTSDWANNENIPSGTERILAIDDEQIILDVNKRILQSLGYQVHCVSSGQQAIEYLKENDVDLILLDMVMPGMDGVETYRRITEFKPHQKCVILSAYPRYHKVVEIQSLGGGPYLVKPPGLAELAQTIRFELDRKPGAPLHP